MKKFFGVIGNPPYDETTESGSTRKMPIYNKFMDEAYEVGDKVELITPARFLFRGGYTPKSWDDKMLADPHMKVLMYEPLSQNVFPGILLEGGVAVTYRDDVSDIGPIGVFVKYEELNRILTKVRKAGFTPISEIISPPLSYQPSAAMVAECPEAERFRSNAFEAYDDYFHEACPLDDAEYIQMEGLISSKRTRRYIRRELVNDASGTLDAWKVLVPESNGASGKLADEPARIISKPKIAEPSVGYLQTYIAVGCFKTEFEANSCLKYVLSKFARVMLGVLKVTQHNPGSKWVYVPLQDFSSTSDIDWSKSIPEIDQQLYAKYSLTQDEIDFIENHVVYLREA